MRAAEWKEFDLSNAEWRIPAERMKMRTAHIVPLSRQAVAVLEELRLYSGEGRYLFPSIRTDVRPISEVTMLNTLRRMGYEKDEMCVHGFRSLASTLLNERGYNRDWIERQLAHSERNGVRATYNYAEYLPERRRMMQEWADYLDELKSAARLPPEEQRRFFEESRDFLTRFVGQENVISAMIHMDEKTPHMHFLHVPVTLDGRLDANAVYTRKSLRRLQSEMPEHLKACGFCIERGVEQGPGARRIHLNTREFKQKKEERERIAADNVKVLRHALDTLYAANELEEHLNGKIKEYEKQAREAERYLSRNEELPEATLFNFKTVLAQARRVIEEQKKALAEKAILEGRKQIADGLLAERNRELKEQARRIDRFRRELEELRKQKAETDEEARALKLFLNQPDEKPRFEKSLADQQEEERRQQAFAWQARLSKHKPAPSRKDDGPSFSPR